MAKIAEIKAEPPQVCQPCFTIRNLPSSAGLTEVILVDDETDQIGRMFIDNPREGWE